MTAPDPAPRSGRETRLLIATLAVSLGVLLLLARFRFPEAAEHRPTDPAPAPLERLAARAAYDELASTMVDLERRIAPSVVVMRVQPERASGGYIVAPRLTADRAVALLGANETVAGLDGTSVSMVGRDIPRELVVVKVPAAEDAVVTPRLGSPRTIPRYVVVVEASPEGPVLRPVYVGRTSLLQEPRTSTPLISFSALQHPIQRGAAVFSLEGTFIGLVSETGVNTLLVAGDFLRANAESADVSDQPIGDLGVEVQALTDGLARAVGADRGVMVSYVQSPGPSSGVLRPGDVIESVDDTAISTVAGFRQVEQTRQPGASVAFSIVRQGTVETASVRAGDAMAPPPAATADDHGVLGRAIPQNGIEVVAVRSGSPAALAGLQRGDLIVLVGREQAPAPAALTRVYREMTSGETTLVGIHRGQQHQIVALEKR